MNKTSTAPLLSCIKRLLSDKNYTFSINFQITQRLNAHPVFLGYVFQQKDNPFLET